MAFGDVTSGSGSATVTFTNSTLVDNEFGFSEQTVFTTPASPTNAQFDVSYVITCIDGIDEVQEARVGLPGNGVSSDGDGTDEAEGALQLNQGAAPRSRIARGVTRLGANTPFVLLAQMENSSSPGARTIDARVAYSFTAVELN